MWENIEILNLSQQKEEEFIRTKLSYYKVLHWTFISNRNQKKTDKVMKKAVYSGLSIVELCKILMYEFWYDYVKPKYGKPAKYGYR